MRGGRDIALRCLNRSHLIDFSSETAKQQALRVALTLRWRHLGDKRQRRAGLHRNGLAEKRDRGGIGYTDGLHACSRAATYRINADRERT